LKWVKTRVDTVYLVPECFFVCVSHSSGYSTNREESMDIIHDILEIWSLLNRCDGIMRLRKLMKINREHRNRY